MVYEERTYTLHPGPATAFLKEYQEHGMRTHHRHLGEQAGVFTTDVGVLKQVVQIIAFLDTSDRKRRREALYTDPEWLAFVPVLTRYVQHMENRLLTPTVFSKLA